MKNRKVKFALRISGVLLAVCLASFIPVLSLKTRGMKTFEGEYITVYYEQEAAAARDIFELLDAESGRISTTLGFGAPQNIRVYIYDRQSTFQTKKYGYIALLLGLDWYVGDNRGTNVLLTSPANPGAAHDYDNVKFTSVHEMVHAYNSVLNKNMPLWVNEGLAVYLTDQNPRGDLYRTSVAPSIGQTHTKNPVTFADIGGYDFAYTYIEYLDQTFGWQSVVAFAGTNDFIRAFGRDENAVYNGWLAFLKENYS